MRQLSPSKATFEGKDYLLKLLQVIEATKERLKAKEIAKILVGETNNLIKQHKSENLAIFGLGKDKSKHFWHAVIRQAMVQKILLKEIESYGVIKISDKGRSFMQTSHEFLLTEDHDYDAINARNAANQSQRGAAADKILFSILKDLRKKVAKQKGLPPAIIFSEPSLTDMANQFPITLEELSQIHGVGQGKARKFGQKFIDCIADYVQENDIERPQDMVVKSIANKSSNKVYIIQSIDRKLPIDDIASAKGLKVDELLTEIETIVESGTRVDINYYTQDLLDEYQEEELDEFFRESEEGSFDEARAEFEEDEYTDEELRLFRIKFISEVANKHLLLTKPSFLYSAQALFHPHQSEHYAKSVRSDPQTQHPDDKIKQVHDECNKRNLLQSCAYLSQLHPNRSRNLEPNQNNF